MEHSSNDDISVAMLPIRNVPVGDQMHEELRPTGQVFAMRRIESLMIVGDILKPGNQFLPIG